MQRAMRTATIRQGRRYDSPSSKKAIPNFIKTYNLTLDDVELPLEEYQTMNQFFARKLRSGARKIIGNDNTVVSAADCRISVFRTIEEGTSIWVKGQGFSLERLLQDDSLASLYKNGSMVIFRLAPQDYHRFHSPVSGIMGPAIPHHGIFNSVHPAAIKSSIDVLGTNERVVQTIYSDHFGKVTLIYVGAMMVGSIKVSTMNGTRVEKGTELGYFQFGGSTVVALFEADKIEFDSDLVNVSKSGLETLIQYGDSIGVSPHQNLNGTSLENDETKSNGNENENYSWLPISKTPLIVPIH